MSSKAKFNKKTAQKFAVVHRPHDDPHFYDDGVSEHVLVPVNNPNSTSSRANTGKAQSPFAKTVIKKPLASADPKSVNQTVGDASLYGIDFDDSKYDYTQHLKPIGLDPEHSVFIPSKSSERVPKPKDKNIENLFVELEYKDAAKSQDSVFHRGVAKPEYLKHQQDISEDIRGFRPDMNPALREVLEALEDEAYVVNEDVVVSGKDLKKEKLPQGDDDDDVFSQLLKSGEAEDEEDFEEDFEEWDIDNLEDFEQNNYREELEQFDKVENLEDLQEIDYQADVRRFKKEQSRKQYNDWDSEGELDEDVAEVGSLEAFNEAEEEQGDEERDGLAELPSIGNKKPSSKKKKVRRKKGAMSDVSGFSMSSSAIARTEVMTILDDKYDRIISGYENYEEEQAVDEEESYKPFDMSTERADFESLLDEFLDNYELEQGGRKLAKKDSEVARFKQAADEVSKGKLSMRRKKEQKNNGVDKVANSLSSLKF